MGWLKVVSVLCPCTYLQWTLFNFSLHYCRDNNSALAVLKTTPISPDQLAKQNLSHLLLFVPLSQGMDDVVLILQLWRCHVCNTSPFKWAGSVDCCHNIDIQ